MSEIDPVAPGSLQARENNERRSYETLGTILLILTVVVVVLLLWRSCSAEQDAGTTSDGGAFIEAVPGLETVEGAVSIWVKEGIDVEAVLSRNGLSGAAATDLGQGTWVIDIGDVDAATTVERLKNDPGLNDAGFLYHDATAK